MGIKSLVNVVIIGVFFGGGIVASRFGIGQFDSIVFTGFRLAIAALAFATFYSIARQRYPFPTDWKLWGHSLLIGTLGMAIPMTCFITALKYQSSGVSAIFVTTGPALIALLAHFAFPDENLNRLKIIGIILALGGALFIALSGESGLPDFPKANPLGYILVTVSVSCHSVATIYLRKYTQQYKIFDVTGSQTFIATLVLLVISGSSTGFEFSRVALSGTLSVFYCGLFSTFFAFWLYNTTVRDFGATIAGMSLYIVPIAATLGGVVLLGETITLRILIGMVIIMGGISLVNYGSKLRNTVKE